MDEGVTLPDVYDVELIGLELVKVPVTAYILYMLCLLYLL